MSDKRKPQNTAPIGYKKPPARTRFQKGRSGNPAGRPKGTPNFATALEQALSEQVIVNEGGQRHTVTKLVATVKQLVNKATQGDPRATQQVLNVLHVLDSDPSASNASTTHITETDRIVMQSIIERISHTTEGENNGTAHA